MALGSKNLRASPESRDREETPLGLGLPWFSAGFNPAPAQIPVLLFPSEGITLLPQHPRRGEGRAPLMGEAQGTLQG